MESQKETRWRQRFINFEKSYKLLSQYVNQPIKTDIERAGIIQFFEITFELSWKLLKDYLEAEGFRVKSPRETFKKAYQVEIIENGHVWLDALEDRNLTVHTYDEKLSKKMVHDIVNIYFPEIAKVYERIIKEI